MIELYKPHIESIEQTTSIKIYKDRETIELKNIIVSIQSYNNDMIILKIRYISYNQHDKIIAMIKNKNEVDVCLANTNKPKLLCSKSSIVVSGYDKYNTDNKSILIVGLSKDGIIIDPSAREILQFAKQLNLQ